MISIYARLKLTILTQKSGNHLGHCSTDLDCHAAESFLCSAPVDVGVHFFIASRRTWATERSTAFAMRIPLSKSGKLPK